MKNTYGKRNESFLSKRKKNKEKKEIVDYAICAVVSSILTVREHTIKYLSFTPHDFF